MVAIPLPIGPVHAASSSGTVCLADPTTPPSPDPCSLGSTTVFDAPLTLPNHQIRIGVYINGSEGFLSFEIVLKTNSTVLKPAGIDTSGSILIQPPTNAPPLIAAECLGTVSLTGSFCEANSTDTLELAAAKFPPLTPTPSTGLLFTAIFNVTAQASSPVPIGFQTGCYVSSVGGGICVAFSNGDPSGPIPETDQPATFNNAIQIPYLTVSAISNKIGPLLIGSTQSLRLNLTGQSSWNQRLCTVCATTLSIVADNSLSVKMNTTTPTVPSSGSAFVTMNITGSTGGNYSLTVYAQYSSADLVNFQPDTLVARLTFQISITDFAISASPPSSIPFLVGTTATSTITVASINGFSGTVNFSGYPNNQCGLNPNSVSVSGSVTSTLSCSWAAVGNYTVAVIGTSGTASHGVFASFTAQDFSVSVSSAHLAFVSGSSASLNLTVTGLNGFSQVVGLSISAPSGVVVSYPGGSYFPPGTQSLRFASTTAGVYNVTLTVSYNGVSRSLTVQVRVTVPAGPTGSPTLFGLPPALVYGLISVLGIIVAVASVFAVRRRRRSVGESQSSKKNVPRKKS